MRNSGAGDDTLIVSKHVGFSIKRNAKHMKGVPKIHDLFSGNTSSNKLRSISCSFNTVLKFAELGTGSLVDQM